MTVTSTTSTPGGIGTSAPTTTKTSLGKDDFLKLLTTQLQHQDPLSPMDSQAFVAQLAQFANVEQLQGINNRLDSSLVAQAANNETQTVSFVGKSISYRSDVLTLNAGSAAAFHAELGGAAASVTATITDASGKTVRTLRMGGAPSGDLSASWDGRDDGGSLCPPGSYHVAMTAADASGSAIPVGTRMHGTVTGVAFDAGYPELVLGTGTGSTRLKLSDVLEIDQPN